MDGFKKLEVQFWDYFELRILPEMLQIFLQFNVSMEMKTWIYEHRFIKMRMFCFFNYLSTANEIIQVEGELYSINSSSISKTGLRWKSKKLPGAIETCLVKMEKILEKIRKFYKMFAPNVSSGTEKWMFRHDFCWEFEAKVEIAQFVVGKFILA